jgi:hypothetical protein
MHQQLWGYKVEWKSVSRGTGGKKVEYHWSNLRGRRDTNSTSSVETICGNRSPKKYAALLRAFVFFNLELQHGGCMM